MRHILAAYMRKCSAPTSKCREEKWAATRRFEIYYVFTTCRMYGLVEGCDEEHGTCSHVTTKHAVEV